VQAELAQALAAQAQLDRALDIALEALQKCRSCRGRVSGPFPHSWLPEFLRKHRRQGRSCQT
jgi:hypothetical protein